MLKYVSLVMIFMGGLVAGMNAASMYPNPNYNAAVWKLSLACFIACVGIISTIRVFKVGAK